MNKISVAMLHNRWDTQHTISHQCLVDIRSAFCISKKWSNRDIITLSSLSYYRIRCWPPVGRSVGLQSAPTSHESLLQKNLWYPVQCIKWYCRYCWPIATEISHVRAKCNSNRAPLVNVFYICMLFPPEFRLNQSVRVENTSVVIPVERDFLQIAKTNSQQKKVIPNRKN